MYSRNLLNEILRDGFLNDIIFKHKVRQAYNAWILELLYRKSSRKDSF